MLKIAELVKERRQTFALNESLDVYEDKNIRSEAVNRRGSVQVLRKMVKVLHPKSFEDRETHLEKIIKELPNEPKDRSFRDSEIRKMELRKEVIGGDFMNSQIDCYGKKMTTLNVWQVREWQMLVFISSTFTDTRAERNILLEKILPYLRKKAYPHDIEVTFVDMRWGVRDENTIDHKTWSECRREIKRCRDESCGLFFLSLQSDKYGYRPLPRKIDKRTFDSRVNYCMDEKLKRLVHEWYFLDENMNPPEYVLKKLDHVNDHVYWREVLPQLRTLLRGIRFDKHSTRHIEVGKSVSEWEVKYAVRNLEDSSRALWIRRQFLGEYEDNDYCDLPDTAEDREVPLLKEDLLEWMEVSLGPTRKKSYQGLISHAAMKEEKGGAFQRYVQQWDDDITALLLRELRKIIRLRSQWESNGCGLGINGHVASEFLHHSKIAHNLCHDFAGREELLRRCLEIICQPNKVQKDKRTALIHAALTNNTTADVTHGSGSGSSGPVADYGAISLVLYGEPGSGKSAFIAKLADEIYQHEVRGDFQRKFSRDTHFSHSSSRPHRKAGAGVTVTAGSGSGSKRSSPRPVLFRFCGTSENSLHSRSLIRSLRLQIQYLLGPTATRFPKPPSDWDILNDLLKHHAVVILLDGVNTLEGGFEFLSHLSLHRDTRIIISVSSPPSLSSASASLSSLPSSPKAKAMSSQQRQHLHSALDAFRGDEVTCLEIPQPANDIRAIMQAVLWKKNRSLTESQWEIVIRQAAVEPSAIYLSLAVQIVEHWHSFSDSSEPLLASSLRGVVEQILDRVEMECGKTLCRLALGLITYSVRGINDNGRLLSLLSSPLLLSLLSCLVLSPAVV
jgi:hypothetical protein